MCILFIAHQQRQDYPLIIAANRDEFYERPSAPADFWPQHPHVLAGKDLRAGGTWMGVSHNGAIAALTNIRAPQHNKDDAKSRGELVSQWLKQNPSGTGNDMEMFSDQLRQDRQHFNGYNLVFGYPHQLQVYNNHTDNLHPIENGVFGLSNADINTPWPKVEQGTNALSDYVTHSNQINPEDLFSILRHDNQAPDHLLPQTGVPHEWEKALSSIFITMPTYGTRTSTLVMVDNKGHLNWFERTFNAQGEATQTNGFAFDIAP